jgi:hypothetical protein
VTLDGMLFTEREQRGAGWLLFAAVILIMSGVMRIIDALWAFDTDDAPDRLRVLLFKDNLDAYGWLWLVVGLLLVAAGFGALAGAEWARVFGIFMAGLAAVTAMLWIYEFPIWSLVSILLSVLVIYALTAYGGPEPD